MYSFDTKLKSLNYLISFLALILIGLPVSGADSVPELETSTGEVSRDGHVKLEWSQAEPRAEVEYEVQQADNKQFNNARTIYKGLDMATFVSGLQDGTYYYRVRQAGGEWSDVQRVDVQHPSLRLTFVLLGTGALVFLLTAGIVIKGARQSA